MKALPKQRFFFTLIAVVCYPGFVQAGAWTQYQGDWQLILNAYFYTADKRFDNKSDRQPINTYNKYEINPYIEYGLTNSVTVGANLSLQAAEQTTLENNYFMYRLHIDPGDSEFFAKGLLFDNGKSAVSATGLIKLPSPRFAGNQPAIGSSTPDLAAGLSAGHGFTLFGLNHFADIGTLYRYRLGDPKDQVNISATLGARLSENWMLMPQAFATFRTKKPANAVFTQSGSDDYNEIKLQLSAVYAFTPALSAQLGGFATVDGKNVGIGRGIVFSIWRKF